jgi:DNA-binding beta-propeller fold protein YncE
MKLKMLLAAALVSAGPACAGQLKQIGTIAVPGEPLNTYDISFWDPASDRYFLADRTNKSLDIFDAKTEKFLNRVPGFVGQTDKNDTSGPDGVQIIGNEAWVGDGDSTVKIIDLKTNKIADTVSTGGKARVDEMSYDPKDHVFISVNNADDPPFVTLISTAAGHKVLGKIEFKDATNGAETPIYFPPNGMFYVAIPQIGPDKSKGGVAVIDPRKRTLEKILPVENCAPAGLVRGPGDNLLLGCTAGDKETGLPPVAMVMNARTGEVVKTIAGPGGNDMVAYNPKTGQYYTASRDLVTGPELGVVNARTNTLEQSIKLPAGGNPHSVAVNEVNNHVYLPLSAKGGGCNGCIAVFAPQ